jgi:hypothetical protein
MPTTMKAILRVEVSGSGTSSATHTVEAEAYDRIEISVPTGSPNTATVDVQPGGAGQVQLLMLTASAYPADGSGAAQLTYTVDGGDSIDLDAPALMVGSGAVGLLGSVNQIVLTNDSDEAVDVSIVVGRDATPAP